MAADLKREQVRRMADLARLLPSREAEPIVLSHLKQILEYVAMLEELETGEIPPSPSVLTPNPLWRPDRPGGSLPAEEAVRAAPEREGSYFRVPRVIE